MARAHASPAIRPTTGSRVAIVPPTARSPTRGTDLHHHPVRAAAIAAAAVLLAPTPQTTSPDASRAAAPPIAAAAPVGATSAPPPSLRGPFPFGVWLQDPLRLVGGKTCAEHYRAMGITHWIGIYDWPSEALRYPGYNLQAAAELQRLGYRVYAGEDLAAVAWNAQNTQFAGTFVGYLVGDEPDMTKATVPTHHPDVFRANCQLIHELDPSRQLWANFGKGFAKIPWNGYQALPGPTIQDDHTKYTEFLDFASVDFYGNTDPYEFPNYCGSWTYGRAIDNTRHYVDASPVNPGIPVWGFVECGSSFANHTGLYPQMPVDLIRPTVWNLIVHGAEGVTYFAHHVTTAGMNPVYPIQNPAVAAAVRDTNRSVTTYGAVLARPTVPGTVVTSTGSVPVTALTKDLGRDTYVFAMGDGNAGHPSGSPVDATIALPTNGTVVEVLGESRTLPIVGSSFTDHFEPYELHVYRIPNSR